jgi:NADPH:quinone reductase
MKAVFVCGLDGPVLEMREIATPLPRAGELLIAVHTVAVALADTLLATGKYQIRPLVPFVPGSECSGVIEAVGEGVTCFRPGDRVSAMGFVAKDRILGTFAEKLVCPVGNVIGVPAHLSLRQAALFRGNYETAHYGLHIGQISPGKTLLVLGGGGGTGFAAVTIGRALGARVIASARTEDRRQLAKTGGADEIIDIRSDDWRTQIARATAGEGVHCVYDPVGGTATERAFRTLAWGGRHVVIGFAAGVIPHLPTNLPLMKGASLHGANLLRLFEVEPAQARVNSDAVLDLLVRGAIVLPPIAREFSLEDAADALAAVTDFAGAGRIVINVAASAH